MTLSSPDDQRTYGSWAALLVGIAICRHQRHFVLSLAHPETFRLMLRHRCGDVLATAALWALLETALATLRRVHRMRPARLSA